MHARPQPRRHAPPGGAGGHPGGVDPARWSRGARRRLGLSQRAFATLTGVSRTHINDIERGRVTPTTAVLDRLLAAADIELTLSTRHPPADDDELVRHLHRSLTQRLRLALDVSS